MNTNTPCPVARTAALLSDEHIILIVRDLLQGPKRFCEIGLDENGILQMSTRTLTKKLQILEEKNIITRHQHKAYPPKVVYELTPLGNKLDAIISAMREYGSHL